MRKQARRALCRVPQLQTAQFLSIHKPGSILVDLRAAALFTRGFIPGSYHLTGLHSVGFLRQNVRPEQGTVYLIGKCEGPRRVVRNFARHRLEIAGWFHPEVLHLWQAARGALATIEELDPEPLTVRLAAWKTVVLDLREPDAFRLARVPDALNLSLCNLRASIAGLPHESALTIVCDTGDKSSFAASLLWNLSYRNVAILRGGFRRYLEAGMPVIRG